MCRHRFCETVSKQRQVCFVHGYRNVQFLCQKSRILHMVDMPVGEQYEPDVCGAALGENRIPVLRPGRIHEHCAFLGVNQEAIAIAALNSFNSHRSTPKLSTQADRLSLVCRPFRSLPSVMVADTAAA
jgi:hypothetical protein